MKITHAPILLVEDDANDVHLIQRAFHRAGIDTPLRIARNAADATDYLAGRREFAQREAHPLPVLLLLDLKMPGAGGLDLIRWVRAQREHRRLPIVVLTSSRDPRDIDAAYDAGASSYLLKPVAYAALERTLTTFGHYWLNYNLPPRLEGAGQHEAPPLPR